MNPEQELLQLARARDDEWEVRLAQMPLDHPSQVRIQLRKYLADQADRGRLRRSDERIVQLERLPGGLEELACHGAEFTSGARLEFTVRVEERQTGWVMKQFHFHLFLRSSSKIEMVRIHLKPQSWHDPLRIPRCHLHVDRSDAHVPFPIMHPRLILPLICEHIEPDFGL
ncbi:MAG TPA: hypothetical protein VE959_16380 [Bryobacteraceae bacterium]|nr:hypothetical protein SBA4_5290004 [Candidatus Sulfopaludibacter sp. SbA4]HYW44441.1 hypothetical protein [Bryobacteraceae bacterium]